MANYSGICSVLGGLVALGALTACGGPDWSTVPGTPLAPSPTTPTGTQAAALFAGKTARSSGKIAPLAAGTLLVTKSGHAVASDPDRDLVHVVDLAKQSVVSVPLEADDEPGRVVEGAPGTAYVAARRGGVVLAIDTAQGSARRIPVCSAPRGLAYDATLSRLYVACRSGLLAVVDGGTHAIIARYRLDSDLRDVLVSGDNLVVTRFKSAEVLVVSRNGEVLRRSQPEATSLSGASVTPSVAFRALGLPGGGVLVGHVDSSNATLPSGAGAYYGAACGGSVADVTVSAMDPYGGTDHGSFTTLAASTLGGATGPLDVALAPDGSRVAMLATGNSWSVPNLQRGTNLWLASTSSLKSGNFNTACGGGFASDGKSTTVSAEGEPVAVAFDADGRWVVQSREPAQLQFEQGGRISLAADSRFDTGFAMFHMNTGGGIACTSCHPEAGEDGHTWNFSVGPRRSQTLVGGASTRSPFHWTGDLPTFDDLVDEVMLKRMSLAASVDVQQRGALRDWLDSVPKAATADDLDADAVERGRVLFDDAELACATCHSGPDYTDNLPHDVGTSGGAFITPSLVDVNLRAPLFHDGCAPTLEARFGACGGGDAHGKVSKLTRADEADLVAFMQSL